MPGNYSTSINILRDSGRKIKYFATPNACRVAQQIEKDLENGLRSFNIIGSYGTGKSAFLWALQHEMESKAKYFGLAGSTKKNVKFINIVGEYSSLIEYFIDSFGLSRKKDPVGAIFTELFSQYCDIGGKKSNLFIVIDEFGKFLEYAAQNQPEREFYFIQQLTEFCNNPQHHIALITTVHQSLDTYAYELSSTQKQEWLKVKGRFREITFNEPADQLLFLAAEHITGLSGAKPDSAFAIAISRLFIAANAFNVNPSFISAILSKLYPLDLFAASLLTTALQRYGQNERSLFSFLESTDHTGLQEHLNAKGGIYDVARVYDYLEFNFYSFLNSRSNPDFSAWRAIRSSLERCAAYFDREYSNASEIIKTIGLLTVFGKAGATLDKDFFHAYFALTRGFENTAELLEQLERKKIIIYRNYSNRYVLFEGTDIDIQGELLAAANKVQDITNISVLLKKHFVFTPVWAKAVSYECGTPRLFEYRVTEHLDDPAPDKGIDGYIQLTFNENLKAEDIVSFSKNCTNAVVFVFYKDAKVIRELLFEIEKTQKVIEENLDDAVASKELRDILFHQRNLLKHKITNYYPQNDDEVLWIYKGEKQSVNNNREQNKLLSRVCRDVYSATPVFHNELVNKHRLSGAIHSAKRLYFRALANNWMDPELGFAPDRFPPEKTIYLSLLAANGLRLHSAKHSKDIKPNTSNHFDKLWKQSVAFLESTKTAKRSVADFIALLERPPFGLKRGLIEFWIPSFFFIKRNDFALFHDKVYTPVLSEEVLELLTKKPDCFEVKFFDIAGVKLDIFNSYRQFLNQQSENDISNQSFIETIKPFLVFYRSLPEYSKRTNRLDQKAISLRKTIASATDPEKAFYEDFPAALGFTVEQLSDTHTVLPKFVQQLQAAIRELRESYTLLIGRVEAFIQNELVMRECSFEEYKLHLQKRFSKIKPHLLLPNQKILINRINSQLDDRAAWISSIAQGVMGLQLDKFTDEDEIVFYDKLRSAIINLDSLAAINKDDIDEHRESAVRVQIYDISSGMHDKTIRFPKHAHTEIDAVSRKVRETLTGNRTVNLAVLAGILQEIMKDE